MRNRGDSNLFQQVMHPHNCLAVLLFVLVQPTGSRFAGCNDNNYLLCRVDAGTQVEVKILNKASGKDVWKCAKENRNSSSEIGFVSNWKRLDLPTVLFSPTGVHLYLPLSCSLVVHCADLYAGIHILFACVRQAGGFLGCTMFVYFCLQF